MSTAQDPLDQAQIGLIDQYGRPLKADPPAKEYMIEFYAYERMGSCEPEFTNLVYRLRDTKDCLRYTGWGCGEPYVTPDTTGYTVIDVLPELTGLPLNDLVMAYVHALRPSTVRISTNDVVTLDAMRWRVTILVDADHKVTRICQEVEVGYGTGEDVEHILRAVKAGVEPTPRGSGVIGHTAGLERIDFQ